MAFVIASLVSLPGIAKGTTIAAAATITSAGADHNALDVILRDASGNALGTNSNKLVVDTGLTTLAVTGPLTDTQLRASPVPISGTVVVSSITNPVAVTGTFWQATQPVSIAASVAVTGPLTDTELRASPVPVSGTISSITNPVAVTQSGAWSVNINNFPAVQPASQNGTWNVGVTNWPTVWNQGLPNLIANAWPMYITDGVTKAAVSGSGELSVTGTFWQATQPISAASLPLPTGAATETTLAAINTKLAGTIAVSGPLTDAQLRATPVPVSGTVALTKSSTATVTNPAASSTNITLLAANASRLGASFFNGGSTNCYLKLGATASSSSYTVLLIPNAYYELPVSYIYTGRIDAIWAGSPTGNMAVSELT